MTLTFAFFLGIGLWEWIMIGTLGLLLFGRRLPEVGKNLGRTFMQFKSEVDGFKEEFREVHNLKDEIMDKDAFLRDPEEEDSLRDVDLESEPQMDGDEDRPADSGKA